MGDELTSILDTMMSVGCGGASAHHVRQWARDIRAYLAKREAVGACPHCAKIVGPELAQRCAAGQRAKGEG